MSIVPFKTRAQRAIFEKIQRYLQQLFGESVEQPTGEARCLLAKGSARAEVTVEPWGEDEAAITVRSVVIRGADLCPELLSFLLRENHQFRLGGFAINADGAIVLQHAIVGSTCDKKELDASVSAVLLIADEYDDKIRAKWGGVRAIDPLG